ncbi:cell division protein FtsZ, partial [Candidatus Peregrinibacteria bacterium CG10_big_fil_rev_8_21_14_0_10_54_7]
KVIFGAYNDKKLKQGQVKVTLIATGFNETRPAMGSLFGGVSTKTSTVGG